jgi:Uma2 family endonuclease
MDIQIVDFSLQTKPMATVMHTAPARHLYTVEEYYRMAELGIIAPDARVELIEGEIIDMAPIGDPHMAVVDWLTQHFIRTLNGRAIVRTQGAIQLGERSMPQPDLILLQPRQDFYYKKRAEHSDALLVVEVSDATLKYDLNRKVPLYARYGIPEVWVLDIGTQTLHTFDQPHPGSTRGRYVHAACIRGPAIRRLRALPEVEVDLTAGCSLLKTFTP